MLRFFRQIRQKLMVPLPAGQAGNKVRSYFFYAFGEIALVMIGILLALQINNWNQERVERRLESNYLKELLEDFKENERRSAGRIRLIDRYLPNLIALLEQSALEKPTVPLDSLNLWFKNINSMPAFNSTNRAYLNITGNGELKIIRNNEIKYAMALYYSRLEIVNLVQNTHELELVETFQPYIIDHMDFQAVHLKRVDDYPLPPPVNEAAILDVLHTQRFRNIITTKWAILTDLLDQFRRINESAAIVLRALEEEIKLNEDS